MKDSNFDFIKDKFENSGVNAPDDIDEALVIEKLEEAGDNVPELTVLPPKQSKKKMFAGISAVAAAAVITAGAITFTSVINQKTVAPEPEMKAVHVVAGLRGFSSSDEVKETMRTVLKVFNYNNELYNYNSAKYYDSDVSDDIAEGGVGYDGYSAGSSGGSTGSSGGSAGAMIPNAGSASTHNSTYVQHTGVDEADTVKTNGKYIFYLSPSTGEENNITVFSAEGEKTQKISDISAPSLCYFDKFYLYGDKLITVSGKLYNDETEIDIYNVADPKKAKRVDSFYQSGYCVSSRMIGSKVYLVTTYTFFNEDDVPEAGSTMTATGDSAVSNKVPVENIFSVETPVNNSFLVVTALDTEKKSETVTKAIIGSGEDIYCNQQNLYVSALETSDSYYRNIVDYASNYYEKGGQSSNDYDEDFSIDSDGFYYKNESSDEVYFGAYVGDETDDSDYWQPEWQPEYTAIIKISLENGLEFSASGKVEGTVNNQYSFDESGGNLRVATTSYDKDFNETNHLFILDKNLKQLGSVKDFAKNETIRAVRYINNTAYVITYMETDPLFVIDLSNPSAPTIKGEVKISGFSTMLVPVDDHTLLGIGYHTNDDIDEAPFDFDNQGALKLVTFDVTDMSAPKVLDTKLFAHYSSDVQYDPKALLVNFERGDYSIAYNYYKDFEVKNGVYRSYEVPETKNGLLNFRIDGGKINVVQDYTSKKFTGESDLAERCVYVDDYMYLIGEHVKYSKAYPPYIDYSTDEYADSYWEEPTYQVDIEAVKYVG